MKEKIARELANHERSNRLMVLMGSFAILTLHIWSLMRFPAPFVDEAWFGSRAWTFIKTHKAFGPLDAGVFDQFEGHWTIFPLFPTLIQSIVLRLQAQPSLLLLRMVSLAFGFMLLYALFLIGRKLSGQAFGFLLVILVATSRSFLYSAHLARYDIFVASLGFCAIAIYLVNDPPRSGLSFITGLCLGLAFETHPYGIVYGPVILFLYFFDYRWSMIRTRHFWSFCAGIILTLIIYLGLHILQYPETFIELSNLVYGPTHTPPLFTFNKEILIQSFLDLIYIISTNYILSIFLILLGLLILILRNSMSDLKLLGIVLTLFFSTMLFVRNKMFYYAIIFFPSMDILISAAVIKVPKIKFRNFAVQRILQFTFLAVLSLQGLYFLLPLKNNLSIHYEKIVNHIKQNIFPTDSIMTSQTYWFEFLDQNYISWENLVYYQRYQKGSTLQDAMQWLKPDVLIIDGQMQNYISDDPESSVYAQNLNIPEKELESFLRNYGCLTSKFHNEEYGEIRIFRIGWDEASGNPKQVNSIKCMAW